jgi:hypothetical protein
MKRLPVIAALIALAAMLEAVGLARATTYGRDASNPACAVMRNNVIGAPYLPEPNRDDTRKAMALAGGARLFSFRARPRAITSRS